MINLFNLVTFVHNAGIVFLLSTAVCKLLIVKLLTNVTPRTTPSRDKLDAVVIFNILAQYDNYFVTKLD